MNKAIFLTPLVALLGACGGDTANLGVEPLFSRDVGSANEALASGETLRATSVSSILANPISGTTILAEDAPKVEISQQANGHLTLKIDGTTYEFTEEDLWEEENGNIYGYGKTIEVEDGSGDVSWVGLFSWQGQLDSMLSEDNDNASQVWQYYLFDEADGLNAGKFATGTQTAPDFLEMMSTATYTGYGQMHIMPGSTFETWGTRGEMEFDVTLNLDIQQGDVSGRFDNLRLRSRVQDQTVPDYEPTTGQFDITDGSVSGGDFSATFSADQTFLDQTQSSYLTGTLDGTLFGEQAEQAAGALSGTSEAGSVLFGHFSTNKQ